MGGVDVKDKSLYHLSCSRATQKYWKKILYNLLDSCVFNSYIIYSKNTDKPLSRAKYITTILEELAKGDPIEQNVPNVPGNQHALTHLPGKKIMKVCPVCGKRAVWWCPGCNCGVHPQCYSALEHFWRPLRGKKRRFDV